MLAPRSEPVHVGRDLRRLADFLQRRTCDLDLRSRLEHGRVEALHEAVRHQRRAHRIHHLTFGASTRANDMVSVLVAPLDAA